MQVTLSYHIFFRIFAYSAKIIRTQQIKNMETYQLACSCGDIMEVRADNKEEAAQKLNTMMDEQTIEAHYMAKHPDEEVPTVAMVHEMITETIEPVPAM
jgi:F420-dependent methylenetetrahydromethanopterin dehydrogenase